VVWIHHLAESRRPFTYRLARCPWSMTSDSKSYSASCCRYLRCHSICTAQKYTSKRGKSVSAAPSRSAIAALLLELSTKFSTRIAYEWILRLCPQRADTWARSRSGSSWHRVAQRSKAVKFHIFCHRALGMLLRAYEGLVKGFWTLYWTDVAPKLTFEIILVFFCN
jgi:hypothetical protein